MTIEELRRELSWVVDEATAPPSRVTATEVYRVGVRRRRARRWFSFAVVTVAVAGAAGGVTAVVDARAAQAPAVPGGPPDASARAGEAAPAGSCRALAEKVSASVEAALPTEIGWSAPRLPAGQEGASCGDGGLFWLSFTYRGQRAELGFEGGVRATGRACDPGRPVVDCEDFDGGQVGHLNGGEEYGVLLRRDRGGVFFFLGVVGPAGERPFTTYELSAAARRIAEEVYR
jgi:hypothetical protein